MFLEDNSYERGCPVSNQPKEIAESVNEFMGAYNRERDDAKRRVSCSRE